MITCPSCGHRIAPPQSRVLRFGDLELHTGPQEIEVENGKRTSLSGNLCRVMAALIEAKGNTCTHDHLLTINDQWDVCPKIVHSEIYRLRRMLADCGSGYRIASVSGSGYRLTATS